MKLEQTWRWYGPDDPVSLWDIKQAGATGIVTALYHIPAGNIWPQDEILKRKSLIEAHDLNWSIVESVPVHESIKTQSVGYRDYLDNYKQTLQNLGASGIKVVCYNFMPLLDWTRTHLNYTLADGSQALRFDMPAYIAFDVFMLKREGAEKDYLPNQLTEARLIYNQLTNASKSALQNAILMGLPGTVDNFSLSDFKSALKAYENIDKSTFKMHYHSFLKEIIPTAGQAGSKMAVHPDDPPLPIFGLPRIVSNEEDLEQLLEVVDSSFNGITFCTGSLGANPDNDVVSMVKRFAYKINFVHLRNVVKEKNGSFYEGDHLFGDVDMYRVMRALLLEQHERALLHETNSPIPIRPDHGRQMLDDLNKKTYPGYSAIGRLKGLAELRGLEMGISRSLNE